MGVRSWREEAKKSSLIFIWRWPEDMLYHSNYLLLLEKHGVVVVAFSSSPPGRPSSHGSHLSLTLRSSACCGSRTQGECSKVNPCHLVLLLPYGVCVCVYVEPLFSS